jgi:triphosphatase
MTRKETELKFEVSPRDLQKLRAARALRRTSLNEENLVSVYFDTPKHTLARNDVTLRVRHNGGNRLQTVKSGGLANSFRRGEWEHQIQGDVPNLRKAQDTALAPLLTKKLKRRLKPIFETRIHRTSVPVRRNGSRIEVVLDQGQVRAGRQSAPIGELELELKRGKAADLFELAGEMVRLVPATLTLRSKSKRGYDLLENKTAEVVRAETIRLQGGMTTVDAFRAIGRSALRHISGNAAAVARSDSEGVHQMRVGLRRLRAAISLFSKLLGGKETERIKSELKWLTEELAPARDLDVYVRRKTEPMRGPAQAKRGMKELARALASRRHAAFDKAKAAVASPRYRLLLLDTLQWIESGDWARRSRRSGQQPIERCAADILGSRTKKAMKKAKKLRELDARQRHKLRVAVKKLRYGSDFFGGLFTGHKAKKRLSVIRGSLKELQDHLGALNDIQVHQKLIPELASGKPRTKRRQRVFAAGVLSGREQSEIEPLLNLAVKDARKFNKTRPFWT